MSVTPSSGIIDPMVPVPIPEQVPAKEDMAALPGTEWTQDQPDTRSAIGSVRHVFTHFSLNLWVARRTAPDGEGWWQPLDSLAEAGLPTLYRRAAEIALTARNSARAAA